MSQPLWDAQHVLTQYRLRIVREEGTARIQELLADTSFSQQFQQILEQTSQYPSLEKAQSKLEQWFLQQQYQRQLFPSTRMWNLLKPLLKNPSSSQATPQRSQPQHSPLPGGRGPRPRAVTTRAGTRPGSRTATPQRQPPQGPMTQRSAPTSSPGHSRPQTRTPSPRPSPTQSKPARPRPGAVTKPASPRPRTQTPTSRPVSPSPRPKPTSRPDPPNPRPQTPTSRPVSPSPRPKPTSSLPSKPVAPKPGPKPTAPRQQPSRDPVTESPFTQDNTPLQPLSSVQTPDGMPTIRTDGQKQSQRSASSWQQSTPSTDDVPSKVPSEAPKSTGRGRWKKLKNSGMTERTAPRRPRRGLPSSTSLPAYPVQAPEETEKPKPPTRPSTFSWETKTLLNQLRLILIKDRSATPLRRALAEPAIEQQFKQTLEQAATVRPPNDGKEAVRVWVFEQAQNDRGFPAQQLWTNLLPLLDEAIRQFLARARAEEAKQAAKARQAKQIGHTEQNQAEQQQTTSKSPEQAPKTPRRRIVPRHKKSLRKRRSSLNLPAIVDPEMVAALAGEIPMPDRSHFQETQTTPQPSEPQPSEPQPSEPQPSKPQLKEPPALQKKEVPQEANPFELESLDAKLEAMIENFPQNDGHSAHFEAVRPVKRLPPKEWIKKQAEQTKPRDFLALTFFLLVAVFVTLDYNPFAAKGPTGTPVDIAPYQKTIPISKAFANKKVVSLVVIDRWHKTVTPQQLELRLIKLKKILTQQSYTKVKVYSEKGRLILSMYLQVRF